MDPLPTDSDDVGASQDQDNPASVVAEAPNMALSGPATAAASAFSVSVFSYPDENAGGFTIADDVAATSPFIIAQAPG